MAPRYPLRNFVRDGGATIGTGTNSWRASATPEDFVLESWCQGFMVGSLLIMGCITVANMRRGVLLHKLILTEQLLAMSHGTFCFMSFNGYGWYLSSTATLLYCSWIIHNIVAWMKIRPFFCDTGSIFKPKTGIWVRRIYLGTLACTVPPIILQIFDNFRFFNNINNYYTKVRPYEPLFRDPWWVFTCITLFHVIRKCYGVGVFELIKRSPRFGILLCAIILAMIFTVMDIVNSIKNFIGSTDGINPWWKLSLVFKCLTDTIMLDDFKTELKRLGIKRIKKEEARRQSFALVLGDHDHDNEDPFDQVHDENKIKPKSSEEFETNENLYSSSSITRKNRDNINGSISNSIPTAEEYNNNDDLNLTFNNQPINNNNSESNTNTNINSNTISPTTTTTNTNYHNIQRNRNGNYPEMKEQISHSPKKINHLPSLKKFGHFKKKNKNDDHDDDEENQRISGNSQINTSSSPPPPSSSIPIPQPGEVSRNNIGRDITGHERLSRMRMSLGIIEPD